MKNRILYVQVECDIWDIANLKSDFEKGNLYSKIYGEFYKIEKLPDLLQEVLQSNDIYTPVTLGKAVSNLGLCASYSEGFVHFYDDEIEFAVSTKDILELAEVFKQYGL